MPRFYKTTLFFFIVLSGVFAVRGAEPIQVWPVDSLEKVFRDTAPGAAGAVALSAARNEYQSGQFGVHADVETAVTLQAEPLVREDGKATIGAERIRLRPIDFIPVAKGTPGAEEVVVRKAPADFPDILRDEAKMTIPAGESKGVWITLFIPPDAEPGRYVSKAILKAGESTAEIPINVVVFPFTLSDARHLWVTNWFALGNIAKYHHVKMWSDDYWPILENYLKNMAEHRQNVTIAPWVPDNDLVKAARAEDGTWSVDFSALDRFLTLAEKCGAAERIEFSHCGGVDREKHEINFRNAQVFDKREGKVVSVEADEWLEPVLKAFEKFLIETNRIDRAMVHVADEPFAYDMASWRAASRRIHAAAPKIKRIDAIESIHFDGELEVWVPKLSHFDRWRDAYEARRGEGEFWFYICCHPFGPHYPNRFMDLPGARVRVLHWINYTERLTGYLHWGLNYWIGDAFGPPTEKYGPGDTHAVYPGKNGPLDSVRWEIERDGLEDYEYLIELQNRTAKLKAESNADLWWLDPERRGMEIARRIVRTIGDTELDPAKFAAAREQIAREITAFDAEPRLVVQTYPKDGAVIFGGPVAMEVYGLTTPGASVKINGTNVKVADDGTFIFQDSSGRPHTLEITASKDGREAKTTRSFDVR